MMWRFQFLWVGWSAYLWPILTIVLIYYLNWRRSRFVRLIESIPGPSTFPLLGNLLDVNVTRDDILPTLMKKWIAKFGSIYRLWFGNNPIIFISSPDLLQPIFTSQKLITKANEYKILKAVFGNSVGVASGNEWRMKRRLLTPAFHFQILNGFVDTFNEKSQVCSQVFEKAIETHGGSEFNIFPIVLKCALDIVCATSMGNQTKSEEEKISYISNLGKIQSVFLERLRKPWLRIEWLFDLTALGRKYQRYVSKIIEFTNEVINNGYKALQQNKINQSNDQAAINEAIDSLSEDRQDGSKVKLAFLELLLKSSETNPQITDTFIKDEVNTIMIVGHDTVGLAMSWFLYCMAKHPEEQELVMKELNQVFGDSDRPCTMEDVSELKYLECCFKETLRIYPSVPCIMRRLTIDVKIGEYVLPAGATAALMIYGVHRNPEIYPEPEVYNPKRFLPENAAGRHPYAFVPFSAGPRGCIGQRYGLIEAKVVLANLLRRFKFSVSDPLLSVSEPIFDVLLKPKNDDISLIVSPRQLRVK